MKIEFADIRAGVMHHWPLIKKCVFTAIMLLVIVIVIRQARSIAWHEVVGALRAYEVTTLLQGVALCVVAYTLYASYDLIGIRYINARVSVPRTMGIAFVAYSINQSFGTLLGTVGMRLRLYGKQGLSSVAISKMIGLAIATNWLGYLLVAGGLFAAGLIQLPQSWRMGNDSLRIIGAVMLLVVIAYLALCRFAVKRAITIRAEQLELPSIGQALAQLLVAALHWFAIAGMLYLLMHRQVDYALILGTYMLTSISAVVAHIPGGIGVVETMFIALLGSRMPAPQIIAALLAFRSIFYIGSLLMAGAVYLLLESKQSGVSAVARDSSSTLVSDKQ